MADTAPVKPDEVPDAVLDAALAAYLGPSNAASPEAREVFRPAIAAALTAAREDIARWISGDRVLTNAEMVGVAGEMELGVDGDAGKVYIGYCSRLVRVWPGGYRG